MRSPTPSKEDDLYEDEDLMIFEEEALMFFTQEGRINLFNYLIANVNKPVTDNVCEWQYCDIEKLPKEELAKWQKACKYELDMLKQHGVFEVTKLSNVDGYLTSILMAVIRLD